jgi:hypothetical protein
LFNEKAEIFDGIAEAIAAGENRGGFKKKFSWKPEEIGP